MFQHILVALDGSESAKRALAEAIDLAQSGHADLTLIGAVPSVFPWILGSGYSTGVDLAALKKEMRQEYAKVLDEAAARVPDGVTVHKVLTDGPAAPAILRQVNDGRHDLVVIGSRGRGDVGSLLLGSVSHHVLNASPVPVLLVHADSEAG